MTQQNRHFDPVSRISINSNVYIKNRNEIGVFVECTVKIIIIIIIQFCLSVHLFIFYKWLKIHYWLSEELHAVLYTIIDFFQSSCYCEWLRREQNLKTVSNVVTFINCVTFAWVLFLVCCILFFPSFSLHISPISFFPFAHSMYGFYPI